MHKRLILVTLGALVALGVMATPGAFGAEVHPKCRSNGLGEGIYPPKNLNPQPSDVGKFSLTFDPTTALTAAQITGKTNGPPWTGTLLCGTNPAADVFFDSGVITSEQGVTIHCANGIDTNATPEGKYCQRQQSKGTPSCKATSRNLALCKDPVAQAASDIPDGAFAGRGTMDSYCVSTDSICVLDPFVPDQDFKTYVDYNTDDLDHGISDGWPNRCNAIALQCFEAEGKPLGPLGPTCNSDTIVSLNDQDPTRTDLTIYPMACDQNIGKDLFLVAVNSFNLCKSAGVPGGSYEFCADVPNNPALWMQTNGWAGPWTYTLVATLSDREHNPNGRTLRATASGVWT